MRVLLRTIVKVNTELKNYFMGKNTVYPVGVEMLRSDMKGSTV